MIPFLQVIIMSIKEYFQKRKELARIKAEKNKLNKMFKDDKKDAESILKQFNFVLTLRDRATDGIKQRIIDEHNLEFCFIPEFWNSFSMARKMAVMVKFSEKHNKYPIRLEDFAIPTEEYKRQERMTHIENMPYSNKLVIDYDAAKMSNSMFVLTALLAYEDTMKEKMFFNSCKKYQSLLDFKSLEELKYFITNREQQFSTYFNNVNTGNQKQLDAAIYQYKNYIDDRAMMSAIDVLRNVAFYVEEAESTVAFYSAFVDYFTRDKSRNIKEVFGGEENLKRQTIKFAYDIFYNGKQTERDVDLKTALNHFMQMKERNYDESMFPDIELPTREEQQKESSEYSLEL